VPAFRHRFRELMFTGDLNYYRTGFFYIIIFLPVNFIFRFSACFQLCEAKCLFLVRIMFYGFLFGIVVGLLYTEPQVPSYGICNAGADDWSFLFY
jgi:hypothetical protein